MQTSTEIGYNSKVEGDVVVTRRSAAIEWFRKNLDSRASWGRKNSLWPMPMGLACCAIELMATGASRFDISRFGAEVMRFSPRQCDVMIVAGTVTYKMALAVKRIYEQMPEPKWVIAMGACASTGGMYRSYAVLQGIDRGVDEITGKNCKRTRPERPGTAIGRETRGNAGMSMTSTSSERSRVIPVRYSSVSLRDSSTSLRMTARYRRL